MASASPLLYSLLESTMTKVESAALKLEFCSKLLHFVLTVSVSPPPQVQDPFSSETLYKKYIGGNKLETTV